MKGVLNTGIVFVLATLLAYVVGSVTFWSLNPADWESFMRLAACVLVGIVTGITLCVENQ